MYDAHGFDTLSVIIRAFHPEAESARFVPWQLDMPFMMMMKQDLKMHAGFIPRYGDLTRAAVRIANEGN